MPAGLDVDLGVAVCYNSQALPNPSAGHNVIGSRGLKPIQSNEAMAKSPRFACGWSVETLEAEVFVRQG